MKYSPTITKTLPNNGNITFIGKGAPVGLIVVNTSASQKIANPPHSKLKGTKKKSIGVKIIFGSGWPDHRIFSSFNKYS
jgi:hypothetical protein